MEKEAIYVGVDVSKAQVDVAFRPPDDAWVVANDDAGLRQLVSRLKAMEPHMVVLEASGGLELPLVAALAVAELPVVVVNPRQVRDFARATGKFGQDRRTRCVCTVPLRRGGQASGASSARCRDPGAQLPGYSKTPGDVDADLGEAPPQHCQRRPCPLQQWCDPIIQVTG